MIDWKKTFPVIPLSRKDISFADIADEQVAHLTESDMEEIAKRVKAALAPPWELLEEIALEVLQAKHPKEARNGNLGSS